MPRRTIPIAITLLALVGILATPFLLCGRGGPPRAKLTGTLVYASGTSIQSLDLATLEQRNLFPGADSVWWDVTEGLSPVVDSLVVFSGMPWGSGLRRIYQLNLRTGDTTAIAAGQEASADSAGRYVSWDEESAVDDPGCKLQVVALDSIHGAPVFSDSGPMSIDGRAGHWSYSVLEPVLMDSSKFAYATGAPEHVEFIKLDTLMVVPMFWRADARRLVVRAERGSGPAWEVDIAGHRLRRLPDLDDALGHAVLGRGDTVLFSASTRRFAGIFATQDLMMLDLHTGEVRLVADSVGVWGPAWYRPR